MKKTIIPIIFLIGAALLILFMIRNYLGNSNEYSAELADLNGMYGAELTARLVWKDKLPEQPAEYWYHADQFTLIPADEPKPPACGLGSPRRGGALVSFGDQRGIQYPYDESEDYRDKVLHVTVSSLDGTLDVKVDWVEAD